jgi:arylsulfatase/uncharacterized sulfatase
MIEHDQMIGKLLADMEAMGTLDNTIIIYSTDNGPEHSARLQGGTTPFRGEKMTTYEGGVRVPLIIAGPEVPSVGLVHGRAHVADLAPTLLDLAGVPFGDQDFDGRSLAPMLTGGVAEVYADTESTAIEVSGTAALSRGKWKITRTPAPYGDGQWRLFDVAADPGETTDLAAAMPERVAELDGHWADYVARNGVVLPSRSPVCVTPE